MFLLQKPRFRIAALATVTLIGFALIVMGIIVGQETVSIVGVACWIAVNVALTHASRVRTTSSWRDTSEKLKELESIKQSQHRIDSKLKRLEQARLKEEQQLGRWQLAADEQLVQIQDRVSSVLETVGTIRHGLTMLQADLHDAGRGFEQFAAQAEHGRRDLSQLVRSLGTCLDNLDGRVENKIVAEIGSIEGSTIAAKVESLEEGMSRLSILSEQLEMTGQQSERLDQVYGAINESRTSERSVAGGQAKGHVVGAELARAPKDEDALKEASRESRIVLGWLKDELVQDVEALIQLHRLLRPSQIVLPLGRGAMDPTAMLAVVRQIVERKPRLVVEVGSGASTIWLGYALKMVGGGRVMSMEHSEVYFGIVNRQLKAHGLLDIVDLRHAPLEDYKIGKDCYPWYSKASIETEEQIDMLIVDGPPGPVHPLARYPAVPLLLERLSRTALVIMDDSNRQAEATIKKKWKAEFGLVSYRTLGPRTQSLLFGDFAPS